MQPRERAILALKGKQPDRVPHFELEMQLVREYFGEQYTKRADWQPSRAAEHLRHDAELLIKTAEKFDYSMIFYSWVYRPTDEDYEEGIRVLRELDQGRHLLLAHGDSTLAIPEGDKMEEYVFDLFDRKDEILAEQKAEVDKYLKRGRRLLAAGLDGFGLCSDYCFNTGPFLSPAMFSEFVAPYLTALIAGYRKMGAYVVKHTDGNIMPILDQLAACRPHGLHSLDPMAGVDIREVKRLYGRELCLMGNVNCALMQTGTDQEILNSCRYAMESGKPGGGYIFSTSNVIFKGMPKHSYDLMLDYYRQHNKY
jgi:uroporphyrinogen decarboxylase